MANRPDKTDELWSQYLEGTLGAGQESRLFEALSDDARRRDEYLLDAQMDRLLRSGYRSSDDEDRAFVDRCVTAGAAIAPAALAAPRVEPDPRAAIAAPPVVAALRPESNPPIVGRTRQSVTVHTPRPSRHRRFRRPSVAVRFLAVTVLAGLLVAVGWTARVLVRQSPDPVVPTRAPAVVHRALSPDRRHIARPEPPVSVARLRPATEVVWAGDVPPPDVPAGSYELVEGSVALEFAEGPVVEIEGPASFSIASPGELNVRRGRLSASSPAARSFVLVTPTSRVLDLGGECSLAVEDSGTTEVRIRRGGAVVEPSTAGNDSGQRWKLGASALNHVTVFAPHDDAAAGPLASAATGDHGQFLAAIASQGDLIEFRSPAVFDQVRRQVVTRYQNSPENFGREWNEFVTRSVKGVFEGSVELNGEATPITDWEDLFAAADRLPQAAGPVDPAGNPPAVVPSTQRFHGAIRINGKTMTFDSWEEFEKARRELFGPFFR